MVRIKVSLAVLVVLVTCSCARNDWRTASRESAGIAPRPEHFKEAVVQVYGAPTWGWRGWIAIHTWISIKPRNADSYTVLEVIGWRLNRGLSVLRVATDEPDRYWFGERPELLLDHRGAAAEAMIQAIQKAADQYPWKGIYRVWPGPNSNTFPAWMARQVPELGLVLPIRAIGKNWQAADE